jgi:serine-type D-Ala-D-Ala carboxypeptidase/endopeptidase (penicillin-binding protein 4)
MSRLFVLLAAFYVGILQAAPIWEQTESLIQDRLPNAHVGFELRDVKTGEVLLARQSHALFTPASSLKLMTAAAAVKGLGPSFRFETSMWVEKKAIKKKQLKGNLWWRFTGDPTLTYAHVVAMAKKLHGLGVRKIQGNIVLDTSVFSGRTYPMGWSEDSIPWGYFAPVSAFIVDHNRVKLRITPGKRLGDAAELQYVSKSMRLPVQSNVRTVTGEQAKHKCNIWLQPQDNNTFDVRGCWPIGSKSSILSTAVRYPKAWAKSLLVHVLAQQGIEVAGKVVFGKAPTKGVRRVVRHESVSLKALVAIMLKYSDNMVAESLLKTMGHHLYGEGSFAQGLRAREVLLADWTGIDFSKSELFDGSGGSGYNILTPHQLTQLMYVMRNNNDMEPVIKALPVAGKDGTLQHRMQVFNLAKHVVAKTGSMRHVSSLTGYLTTRTGRILAFSVLMDHVLPDINTARLLQHELCDLWVNSPWPV